MTSEFSNSGGYFSIAEGLYTKTSRCFIHEAKGSSMSGVLVHQGQGLLYEVEKRGYQLLLGSSELRV